jgi:alpha-glucosidase (family GH31 glycosyl hydrolase)
VSDEYLFGPDLLVAPVMEAGLTQRQVYLPDGAQWTNAWLRGRGQGNAMTTGRCLSVAFLQMAIALKFRYNGKLL